MKYGHLHNKQILEKIANNIDTRREAAGLSLTKLAETSAVSRRTLQYFIKENADIKLSTLISILKSIDSLDLLNTFIDEYEHYSPVDTMKHKHMKNGPIDEVLIEPSIKNSELKDDERFAAAKNPLFAKKTEGES